MQGIEALTRSDTARGPRITEQQTTALERSLSSISPEEIESLRELQDELQDMSAEDIQALIGILDFLQKNERRYPEAVRFLIQRELVEPGDLPPEYVPAFFAILRRIALDALRSQQRYATGGVVSLRRKAEEVREAGRNGDTMLAHITPGEAAMLKRMGGSGTINPKTGLPEFFLKSVGKFLKKAAPVILPVALNFIAPGLGAAASGFIGAGVGGLIAGQKPGDALKSALVGGVTGAVYSGLTGPGTFMENVRGGMPSFLGGAERPLFAPSITGGAPTVPTAPVGAPTPATAAADIPMEQAAKPAAGISGIVDKTRNLITANPFPAVIGAGLIGSMLGGSGQAQAVPALGSQRTGTDLLRQQPGTYGFDVAAFRPRYTTGTGVVPTPSPAFPAVAARTGGHISGPGTGTSDSIPAYLSDGEFVLTAKAVKGAGEGDRMKGAKRLYKLMNQLERRA